METYIVPIYGSFLTIASVLLGFVASIITMLMTSDTPTITKLKNTPTNDQKLSLFDDLYYSYFIIAFIVFAIILLFGVASAFKFYSTYFVSIGIACLVSSCFMMIVVLTKSALVFRKIS